MRNLCLDTVEKEVTTTESRLVNLERRLTCFHLGSIVNGVVKSRLGYDHYEAISDDDGMRGGFWG